MEQEIKENLETSETPTVTEQPETTAPTEEKPVSSYLCKFTVDGEILVEKRGEETFEYPLKTVELQPLPQSFKEAHVIEMKLFHSLVKTIKKNHPNREVPVLRNEFLRSGADTKLLRDLIGYGLLKEAIIPLLAKSGKNPGSRACLYYTPQGRALIRAKLEPDYALTDYH